MTRPNPRMAPKISQTPVETGHPQECILTECVWQGTRG